MPSRDRSMLHLIRPAIASVPVLLLGVVLTILPPSLAAAAPEDDAVRRVALQLQCPVCEGESVADSTAGLARDMRTVIRARQAAGESDQQILAEFAAAYGDGILAEPPKRGIGLGVWVGPLVALAAGTVLLGALARRWRRRATPGTPATPLQLDPRVAGELQRFRTEVGL